MKYVIYNNFWGSCSHIKNIEILPPDNEFNVWRLDIQEEKDGVIYILYNFNKELLPNLVKMINQFLITDGAILDLSELSSP